MKLYVEPLTVGLLILLCGSIFSDKMVARQDRKELKNQIDNGVKLSSQVSTLSSNVLQVSQNLNTTIKEKAEVEKKFEAQLAKKDEKTGELFGVLAGQAASIAQTSPASDTIRHFNTAQSYMQLYGGTIADSGLAWNTQYIKAQATDYEQIKAQLEVTKRENEKLSQSLEKTSIENVQLSGKLNEKAVVLEQTIGKVQLTENLLYSQKSWLQKFKQIIFYSVIIAIIGALCYVGFHVLQILNYRKQLKGVALRAEEEANRRRESNKEKYELEKQASELKTSIKTFMSIDKDGNPGIKRILRSNGLKKHFEDFKDIEGKTIDEE